MHKDQVKLCPRVGDTTTAGVCLATRTWLTRFQIPECTVAPDKLLVVWPQDNPIISKDHQNVLRSIIEQYSIPHDSAHILVACESTDFKQAQQFATTGTIGIYGPTKAEWPNCYEVTWAMLTSIYEINLAHWSAELIQYYTKYWPALCDPIEYLCNKMPGITANSIMSELGIMPARLIKLRHLFDDAVLNWSQDKWLTVLNEVLKA